jgi:hypothetical protein
MKSFLAISVFTVSAGLMAADVSSSAARPVTFAKDVAPILQERCQECHHAGAMAPMSLVTYEETRPWARAMKDRVVKRQMPPWHIDMHQVQERFFAKRPADRHHREVGRQRRASGRRERYASAKGLARG